MAAVSRFGFASKDAGRGTAVSAQGRCKWACRKCHPALIVTEVRSDTSGGKAVFEQEGHEAPLAVLRQSEGRAEFSIVRQGGAKQATDGLGDKAVRACKLEQFSRVIG